MFILMIVLLTLCLLFVTLIIWLAHSLEGYPALLISQAHRDAVQAPPPRFVPNNSVVLDALANIRPARARPERWTASTALPRAYHTNKRNKTAAI